MIKFFYALPDMIMGRDRDAEAVVAVNAPVYENDKGVMCDNGVVCFDTPILSNTCPGLENQDSWLSFDSSTVGGLALAGLATYGIFRCFKRGKAAEVGQELADATQAVAKEVDGALDAFNVYVDGITDAVIIPALKSAIKELSYEAIAKIEQVKPIFDSKKITEANFKQFLTQLVDHLASEKGANYLDLLYKTAGGRDAEQGAFASKLPTIVKVFANRDFAGFDAKPKLAM